jgi:diaminopimelate epimerase
MKGHGTENDFVLITDFDATLDLTPGLVRALCDRHAGIGADGVLRVVRSRNHPAGLAMAGEAEFFMDYRNADGSLAEMCGNGVRVFLRYLQHMGLAGRSAAVATRGGVRQAWLAEDGQITVGMGWPQRIAVSPKVSTHDAGRSWVGVAIEVPNPHVVIDVGSPRALRGLDLTQAPLVEPALPAGQNVEFVARIGPHHLAMRVYERGVGETRSCGTGICAAVVAFAGVEGVVGRTGVERVGLEQSGVERGGVERGRAEGGEGDHAPWLVDVPGGRCQITWQPDGELLLTGPAVLVGQVELSESWLAAAITEHN